MLSPLCHHAGVTVTSWCRHGKTDGKPVTTDAKIGVVFVSNTGDKPKEMVTEKLMLRQNSMENEGFHGKRGGDNCHHW
ncbi:MAG: hypothetical protein JSV05_02965 [Candidatus Bathyarchaeota archaeon]|nr:MAG: hypothetical protein JSV05_02965 [Candidatus Bathyarchaeota archaeon]